MQQLDWSPDGLRLASASQDGLVRIWDASRAARVLARQNLRARLSDLRAKKKFQEAIDLLQSLPADENETAPHFRPSSDHRGNSANATVQVPDLSDDLEVEMLLQQFQLDRARQMVRDGELDAATILYRQLSADSPELPDPRLLLADALFYPGNEAKALQWLENVVAESPENEDYGDKLAFRYQLAAISLCRAGRFDEAVPILTKLAGRFPDRRDFRPHLAALMAVAHRLKETIAMFEKVTVPPAWPDYRPELARRLLALLNDPEVVAFYRQMTADFPDVPEYRRGLGSVRLTDGVALFSAGDWQESLEPLSEAVELLAPLVISESQGPPDYDLTNRLWEAYHRRAGSRLNLGELDGAIADYSEAIRVVPDDPMPYCWRAVAYLKRGEIDKARVDCEAYLKLPRSCGCTPLAQTLAERLRPGGAPKWALAVARKTVELSPESAEAWKSLGLLHVAAGDRHQAAIALKQAVELAPGDESLRSLLDEEPRQTTPEEPKQ
ncbi:MAG: tetratricopeptide repeat protein [Pirellulales bacterium]|nr:tetratricopeptide repeat protein [Pirellulales bacterium]